MAGLRRRTQTSFRKELPALLRERGISQREFAKSLGLAQSYLSRTMNSQRSPSKNLLEKAARELGLPKDYFPEYRELIAIERLKRDPALRDRIYDGITRAKH